MAVFSEGGGGVTQKIRRGPDMGCLCLHIKKGEDLFYKLNAHFIFAKSSTVLHLSKKGGCRSIKHIDAVQRI